MEFYIYIECIYIYICMNVYTYIYGYLIPRLDVRRRIQIERQELVLKLTPHCLDGRQSNRRLMQRY